MEDTVGTLPNTKKRFRLFTKFLVFLLFSPVIILFIIFATYNFKTKPVTAPPAATTNKNIPNVAETSSSLNKVEIQTFSNDKFGFSFLYQPEAKLRSSEPFSENANTVSVNYDKTDTENIDETNLKDGYIFKIKVYEDLNKPLRDFANEKRNYYSLNCPNSANISQITDTTIDNAFAKTFEVLNCNLDYIEYFAEAKNNIFEITLISIGDFGYKQVYKTKLTTILNSIDFFYNNNIQPISDKLEYRNDLYKFTFEYVNIFSDCCAEIAGPLKGKPILIKTFSQKQTSQGKPAGIAFYIDNNELNQSFNDYLENQKNSLAENYKLIVGKNPALSFTNIKIDFVDAVVLDGYAWWGKFIYLQIPNSNKFLAIVINNTESTFEQTTKEIQDILNSWKFFE